MARVYAVQGPTALRFAGSVAHARQQRDELVEELNLRKKDISIDTELELPTNKAQLLDFLNVLLRQYDNAGVDANLTDMG